jgi:Zn-dependent protease
MGHKFMAKKLGCMASFKLWTTGLLIAVISIFLGIAFPPFREFGFVFLALGYIEIMPYSFGRWGFKVTKLTPKDLGLISLSGVGVNILLAVFFKMFPDPLFQSLSYFNGMFALFNLLPIPPLDGTKIFMWKMWFWLFLMFITVLTLFVF